MTGGLSRQVDLHVKRPLVSEKGWFLTTGGLKHRFYCIFVTFGENGYVIVLLSN
jgi:hypothetical protein